MSDNQTKVPEKQATAQVIPLGRGRLSRALSAVAAAVASKSLKAA